MPQLRAKADLPVGFPYRFNSSYICNLESNAMKTICVTCTCTRYICNLESLAMKTTSVNMYLYALYILCNLESNTMRTISVICTCTHYICNLETISVTCTCIHYICNLTQWRPHWSVACRWTNFICSLKVKTHCFKNNHISLILSFFMLHFIISVECHA